MKPRLAQQAAGRMNKHNQNQKHKQEADTDCLGGKGGLHQMHQNNHHCIHREGLFQSSLYIYSPPKRQKLITYTVSVANIARMATKLQK